MGDAPELVDETSHAGVGRAYHRQACLDAAKNRARHVLPRSGRTQEPAVVRDVHEQVRAGQNKLAREIADRVFETNQWRDPGLVVRQFENRMLFSESEIVRHLVADDAGEEGNGVASRDVFAERHEMDFAINLDARAGV